MLCSKNGIIHKNKRGARVGRDSLDGPEAAVAEGFDDGVVLRHL